MRIIAGRFKGRKLETVRDLSVRPATDRVKQTVFDVLEHRIEFEGISVLDLFAGSGSLGIESLSRGAGHATFVESNPEAVTYLERNLQAIGCERLATTIAADAGSFVLHANRPFDLVFVDPPYAYPESQNLPDTIFRSGLLKLHGFLVFEHASSIAFGDTPQYATGPIKKFGRTMVTFFHHQRTEGVAA
jgi:16S rRNA (guanine966-N2)-methyltransferase